MPLMSDLCLWCNKKFGDHLATTHIGVACFDGKHTFVAQGGMKMADFPIGTVVEYYTKGGAGTSHISATPTTQDYYGTIRAIHNPLFTRDSILLGWTAAQSPPTDAWEAYHTTPEYGKLLGLNYAYGLWIDPKVAVKRIISMPSETTLITQQVVDKPKGMHCSGKHCGTFNDYAQPNQPDGTFLCYTCRSKYH